MFHLKRSNRRDSRHDNADPMIMSCVLECVSCGMSLGICFDALKLCCHAKETAPMNRAPSNNNDDNDDDGQKNSDKNE